MDENKFEGVTKINDHEFELHNAHCFMGALCISTRMGSVK